MLATTAFLKRAVAARNSTLLCAILFFMDIITALNDPYILLLILLWVLPWKGYALWLASRRSQKWWFVALLVINTLAILEIIYIFFIAPRYAEIDTHLSEGAHEEHTDTNS